MQQKQGWLVDSAYEANRTTLVFLSPDGEDTFRWVDDQFRPYFLTEGKDSGDTISKVDLFTQETRPLIRVKGKKPAKGERVWEGDVDPALSYAYDNGLTFGMLHKFADGKWVPERGFESGRGEEFNALFGHLEKSDRLKYDLLRRFFSLAVQPLPTASPRNLGIESGSISDEEYFTTFLLSRFANLPMPRAFRNFSVSEWIRSMLLTHYRANNILYPRDEELRLGDKRKWVTGALTIAPVSGSYFDMVVLDFESLYPGCIDVFNLSYETVKCPHQECATNKVPDPEGKLNYHVCTKRRGIYSALTGALREMRVKYFKPLARSGSAGSVEPAVAAAASNILKLFLVSCYGVTVRIHGLASPLLAEAITAYGRHVLQSTWNMAQSLGLRPRYGDTDSIFLDAPTDEQVREFVAAVKSKFGLELAFDRLYSVCVLSAAKKAYFGIMPDGQAEVKGLTVVKSNSPRFFQETFRKCLSRLSTVRTREELELAKNDVEAIVVEAVRNLREGKVRLDDLEYKVELREDPEAKFADRTLPQAYQAARLLYKSGRKLVRRETVGFVKVRRFKFDDRYFTVKPIEQAEKREVNTEDYIRNLLSSLAQTFEPMGIDFQKTRGSTLADFV